MRMVLLIGAASLLFCTPANAKPTVLLVHGGGFFTGQPSDMNQAASEARERGFKPVKVRYRMRDIGGAVQDVVAAAKRHDAEFAVGHSAGGSLAGVLANRGLVDRAVLIAAPVDLPRWFASREPELYRYAGFPTHAEQVLASPALHRTRGLVTVFGSDADPMVSPQPAKVWAERSPRVTYRPLAGTHRWNNPKTYPRAMRILSRSATRVE